MVHKKVRRVKKGVKSAKDKASQFRFKQAIRKARAKERAKKKNENVKKGFRSKTAPVRIEAKATKKELGELGQELGITRERGQKAKRAGSKAASFSAKAAKAAGTVGEKTAEVTGTLLAVDQDSDGRVDDDELFFGVDTDDDGQPDRVMDLDQVERELVGRELESEVAGDIQSEAGIEAIERDIVGDSGGGRNEARSVEEMERELVDGLGEEDTEMKSIEEMERDLLDGL